MIEHIYKIYSQPLSNELYTLSKSDLRIGSDPKSFGQALLNSSKRRRK
jgi:hypothetical protein